MKAAELSLAPLKRALESLEKAIKQERNEFTQDSVIQRFEYTFELSWKICKKVLELDKPLTDESVRGILREAHQQKLISDLEKWFSLHKARNLTSLTYNPITAAEVYHEAIALPDLCHKMINIIESKLSIS